MAQQETKYHRLWGMRCYLIGAMDRVPDGGEGWRTRLTPFLDSLGTVVLDPCDKPIDIGLEDIENRQHRRELKFGGFFDQLTKEIKLLRVVDLRMVDMADFVIVNIDTEFHACGTYEETSWANRMKNPILIRCEQGKKGMPDWMFGCIPHQHMFDTWTDLYKYLWHVHTSTAVESYKRWMFFDYERMVPKVTPEESEREPDWEKLGKTLDLAG